MELKSAAQNNRVKAVYSIAQFRSHGALNQAAKQGLSAKSLFSISECTDRASGFSADNGNFLPNYCMYFKKNWLSMPENQQARCVRRDTKQALKGLTRNLGWVRLKFAAMNLKKYAIHRWHLCNYFALCLLSRLFSFTA